METGTSTELDEQILKGEPAPFTGVLVYPEIYKDYQKTIQKYNYRFVHDEALPCEYQFPEVSFFGGDLLLKVGIGLIIGFMVGRAIPH